MYNTIYILLYILHSTRLIHAYSIHIYVLYTYYIHQPKGGHNSDLCLISSSQCHINSPRVRFHTYSGALFSAVPHNSEEFLTAFAHTVLARGCLFLGVCIVYDKYNIKSTQLYIVSTYDVQYMKQS